MRQSGFSLLELVIVIILVILLFLAAWWRLLPLRGSAEAAHVATTVGTLRSALGMHVAERIVAGEFDTVANLDGSNPMGLLERAPANYLGSIETGSSDIVPGSWYFERASGRLAYRVRHPQYLSGDADGPVDLHWRVEVEFQPGEVNRGASGDRIREVRIEALHDRQWHDTQTSELTNTAQPRPVR